MVQYMDSAHLIPEWVHQFWQWHINMFKSLDEAHQRNIKQHRVWIVYPHATFERLAPSFIIPAEPILVPVPLDNAPQLLDLVMWSWCSHVVEYIFGSLHQIQLAIIPHMSIVAIRCLFSPLGVLGVPLSSFLNSNINCLSHAWLFESLHLRFIVMTPQNCQARRCMQNDLKPEVSLSFYLTLFYFFSYIFLHFNVMPDDGVGQVAPHGNQKQTHQALLAVRQNRWHQTSPESQACPFPKLIGLKELEELCHNVPPVSCFFLSHFLSFTNFWLYYF